MAAAGAITPQAKVAETHVNVLCKPFQHMVVGHRGLRYVIRNDNYGRKPECITNHGGSANFAVTKSGARVAHFEPVAYPNIFLGCRWGVCSPHSGLPRRADRLRSLVTSWSITDHAYGIWSAGYDIWFDRVADSSGQSSGAELMIWLNARRFPAGNWPVVVVGHVRWYLAHWVTSGLGKSWNYIQFRRVRPTTQVRNLNVRPFIQMSEHDGLISPRWWLISVEAGFEIWRGGTGLGTTHFSAGV